MAANFKDKIRAFVLRFCINPLKKYSFGFRAGGNFYQALDGDSQTTLKEATVDSLKDGASSTGQIMASRTLFSLAKASFLETAVGAALVSSPLYLGIQAFLAPIFLTISHSVVGLAFSALAAWLSASFATFTGGLLTLVAGTAVGKLFAATPLGSWFFGLCRLLISMITSVIPLLLLSILTGYVYRLGREKWEEYRESPKKSS